MRRNLLVSTFLGSGSVIARLVSVGERAVILSITMSRQRIVWVIPGVAQLGGFLGGSLPDRLLWQRREKLWVLLHLGLGWWGVKSWSTCILRSPDGSIEGERRLGSFQDMINRTWESNGTYLFGSCSASGGVRGNNGSPRLIPWLPTGVAVTSFNMASSWVMNDGYPG